MAAAERPRWAPSVDDLLRRPCAEIFQQYPAFHDWVQQCCSKAAGSIGCFGVSSEEQVCDLWQARAPPTFRDVVGQLRHAGVFGELHPDEFAKVAEIAKLEQLKRKAQANLDEIVAANARASAMRAAGRAPTSRPSAAPGAGGNPCHREWVRPGTSQPPPAPVQPPRGDVAELRRELERLLQVKDRKARAAGAAGEAPAELRVDPSDGEPYTKQEFLDFYGSHDAWASARPHQPPPPPPQQQQQQQPEPREPPSCTSGPFFSGPAAAATRGAEGPAAYTFPDAALRSKACGGAAADSAGAAAGNGVRATSAAGAAAGNGTGATSAGSAAAHADPAASSGESAAEEKWVCRSCGTTKSLSGSHLAGRTEVRSQCSGPSCHGTKRSFRRVGCD
eukprot:TRINITY_DN4956_c0_g2_i3.p1 TRINITY_DN4956_c0_g2~~TRINITY_DN4956_c0_g2_i3.p1  ORF type:complete len:423 (+),score=115.94 TRINITY_DN4956_c0_g2_i3:97-1269(+)